MRDGIALLLAQHLRIQLVGSYSDQDSILIEPPNPKRHVVLLDGVLGPRIFYWIRYWHTRITPALVIVLDVQEDANTILACIEAGAGGYTLRGACVEEVARVVCSVLMGNASCSPEIAGHLFARLAARQDNLQTTAQIQKKIPLTVRERDVLRLVALGRSNREIADALFIEVRTVKHHIHNMLEKMALRRRGEAVRVATESGWLDEMGSDPAPNQQIRR